MCTHIDTYPCSACNLESLSRHQRRQTQTVTGGWQLTQTLHCATVMLYHCSTHHHCSTALHIDATSWQRSSGVTPQLFLGFCSQFSPTQKACLIQPPPLVTAAGREKVPFLVYSAHPASSQADLRKCPFGTCHMCSDWQGVKFDQNNCGNCCCLWAASTTSSCLLTYC